VKRGAKRERTLFIDPHRTKLELPENWKEVKKNKKY